MAKVKSLADLKKIKQESQPGTSSLKNNNSGNPIQIRVAMATCGIASGSREMVDFFRSETSKKGIQATVSQTGCMGYCYAEPTVEVKKQGKDPVVFGDVNAQRANEIIERYIKNDELVDGVIPVNYQTIDN